MEKRFGLAGVISVHPWTSNYDSTDGLVTGSYKDYVSRCYPACSCSLLIGCKPYATASKCLIQLDAVFQGPKNCGKNTTAVPNKPTPGEIGVKIARRIRRQDRPECDRVLSSE
jgi:hypothetical protein